MDELQRTRILDKLYILVPTIPQESKAVIGLTLDILVQKILNYCCRKDIPPALELIIIDMMSTYANAKYNVTSQDVKSDNGIKAITRGKTKIEYNVAQPTKIAVTSTDDLIKVFKSQLNRFKKLISPSVNEVI